MTKFRSSLKADIVIVGSGAAGLFCALNLPANKNIIIITKDAAENSDSYLAQGGICMMRNEEDYHCFLEDTLRAGHYKNNKQSVDIMIRSSQEIIQDLIDWGVEFEKSGNEFLFTREGAHSVPRILYHKDITGKEITSKLLNRVQSSVNIKILEYTTMLDIIPQDNICHGIVCKTNSGELLTIQTDCTVLATGGIGGLFSHSTNFSHLTGDALGIAIKHGIALENMDYIQIHPTTLYTPEPGRSFLISESVRGEGAVLLNAHKERFVNELLPRDVVSREIYKQMVLDQAPHVWLSLLPIEKNVIKHHFPNIYEHCLQKGYDVTKEAIPVVPAQHYFMGGIRVDSYSQTSMEQLYAIGETSCNGVHGANRLASNSLLETLVFAKRAAEQIKGKSKADTSLIPVLHAKDYKDHKKILMEYKKNILNEIERMEKKRELHNDEA
ncbi:L-aspartate oxidase [Aminipila sp.]|uniref:L-aspartate oxidase n=3 Tax=Aminipila sp. TaxID=2060095 RepID=UPI00289DFE41|nr:L-aspartate oxidase [Aminipila sp.]